MRVLAIAPKARLAPEMVACPCRRLHPPLPLTAPSPDISSTDCRLSITPRPRISSASQRPAGEGGDGGGERLPRVKGGAQSPQRAAHAPFDRHGGVAQPRVLHRRRQRVGAGHHARTEAVAARGGGDEEGEGRAVALRGGGLVCGDEAERGARDDGAVERDHRFAARRRRGAGPRADGTAHADADGAARITRSCAAGGPGRRGAGGTAPARRRRPRNRSAGRSGSGPCRPR